MTHINLHPHEVRRLLDVGAALIVRPEPKQPPEGWRLWGPVIDGHAAFCEHPTQGEKGETTERRSPFGLPGTIAWGRETWRRAAPGVADGVEYRADNLLRWFDGSVPADVMAWVKTKPRDSKWYSLITMPKILSRFPRLVVGETRLLRVGELSEADMLMALNAPAWLGPGPEPYKRQVDRAFAMEWETIYKCGKRYPYPSAWCWAVLVTRKDE
jgi:hypothetical protein